MIQNNNKFFKSLKKNKNGIILIFIAAFFTSIGQFCWKIWDGNIYILLIGFLLYGIGAVLMICSFKYGSYSVIQPFISISYIFSLFLGYILLNELLTFNKIIGVFVIMLGVIFIAIGDD